MRHTLITALILGAMSALPLQAQSSDQNGETDTPQATQDAQTDDSTGAAQTGENAPAEEARPKEAEITAMADGGPEWTAEYVSEDGEQLYQTLCAGCHMPDGSGAEGAGQYPALSGNPNLEYSGYATYLIVNGQAGMPSLGHFLDDTQVVAITDYIQTNLGNDYETDGTVEAVADARPADPADQNTEEHE
ncbi:c-type cytochrome [Sulfitobacter aestuarii]|uniref:C-type cytochrome n=1 Tax=Sulfitobacter aestuarii TaxID=2161676 RepID=A0ABW5U442_9RHOB